MYVVITIGKNPWDEISHIYERETRKNPMTRMNKIIQIRHEVNIIYKYKTERE
jgi:hypothetical protein